jgi:hypothetical protein
VAVGKGVVLLTLVGTRVTAGRGTIVAVKVVLLVEVDCILGVAVSDVGNVC